MFTIERHGTVIWGKDENKEVPMASTTKIMTAIVLLETIGNDRLNEEVIVSKEAANTPGSRVGLRTGDRITYNDLLHGLMICSGNDAAVQIAISISGSVSNFAELMNKKALELGLEHTHFVTPHGLDENGHYTTALELAKMADYALKIPKFAQVVNTKEYNVNINGEQKRISNTNELLGYLEGVNGCKTGYTSKAGRCLVTSANRNDFNIITVVLGADTRKIRTQDSIKLIEYTYKNYKLVNIKEMLDNEYETWCKINGKRINIYKGTKKSPNTYLDTFKYTMYPIKQNDNINFETVENLKYEAPLEVNTEIGKIKIKNNNEVIDEVSIKSAETINKKGIVYYIFEIITLLKEII